MQGEHAKYCVSVDEVKAFHEDGFLIVQDLVSQDEVQELLEAGIRVRRVLVVDQLDRGPCTVVAPSAATTSTRDGHQAFLGGRHISRVGEDEN